MRVEIAPQPAVAGIRSNSASSIAERGAGEKIALHLPSEVASTAVTLSKQLPSILVALLTPAALVALAMGLWRVGADLAWAGAFPITGGFFSHWQVWIALSIALKMLSSSLLAWDSRIRKVS